MQLFFAEELSLMKNCNPLGAALKIIKTESKSNNNRNVVNESW